MGRFLNPDHSAFQTTLNSEIYVDKTELIDYINRAIFFWWASIMTRKRKHISVL